MNKRVHKKLKYTCWTLAIVLVALFAVNWYLKFRLENYLKKDLSQKILQATDGVYLLDFRNLSVSLLSGELLIEGITLRPDSVFLGRTPERSTKLEDYLNIEIGSIHFKGLNLTWHRKDKKLHFDLFQIKQANINIYASSTNNDSTDLDSYPKQSLYDIISPYINELLVKRISLENSSVYFRVTNHDAVIARYAIEGMNFEAHSFVVNKDSEQSGKLLYCDNFNFHANKPQRLISNGQFSLLTDRMIFDTKDSIIQIQGVKLVPRKKLWRRVNQTPDSYLEGKLSAITVEGLSFQRKNAQNVLKAASFKIQNPDIAYFSIHQDSLSMLSSKPQVAADTINLSWSLYSILSPILSKVSINTIDVNNAQFRYTEHHDQYTNTYALDRLDLRASNFLVDSLSGTSPEKRFLYSEGFILKAQQVKGENEEKNHQFEIQEMLLNTLDRSLNLHNIKVKPISEKSKNDYIRGFVDNISIDGLQYNKGLYASSIEIESPNIEYTSVASSKYAYTNLDTNHKTDNGSNVWQQIYPFFNHLNVKSISLKNGNIALWDKVNKDRSKVSSFEFYASNLMIDQETVDQSNYLSACGDFGFSFEHLDVESRRYNHRIKTQKTAFSRRGQSLKILNLNISPIHTNKDITNRIELYIPSIDIKGIDFTFAGFQPSTISAQVINLVSPRGNIAIASKQLDVSSESFTIDRTKNTLQRLNVSSLHIFDSDFSFVLNKDKDTLHNVFKKLEVDHLLWTDTRKLHLGRVLLSDPQTKVAIHSTRNKDTSVDRRSVSIDDVQKSLEIDWLKIKNSILEIHKPDEEIIVGLPTLGLSRFRWSPKKLILDSISIQHPLIKLSKEVIEEPKPKHEHSRALNIYQRLSEISNDIFLKSVKVTDANLDYKTTFRGEELKHLQLNKTSIDLSEVQINTKSHNYNVAAVGLNTKDIRIPIQEGIYTLGVDEMTFDSRKNVLTLDSIALIPKYSKQEFAYKDPSHSDWFDVTVANVTLSGIDLPSYIKKQKFYADSLTVNNVLLQNYKNQNIEIEHHIMPMIYQGLQKFPIKLYIPYATVNNFNVVYEELPKNGTTPLRVVFSNLNGRISDITNVASKPDQMIQILADGTFMNTGRFTARWMLPVSTSYDCFMLDARMLGFKMASLNQIIEPMAPVRINDGLVSEVTFKIEGSSVGANVEMLMLYNDLNLTIQKGMDNSNTNKFLTKVTNAILKQNNPNKPSSKPRRPNLYVDRDPYHSTFNYLWQILQPPLVETVGISQRKQNFIKKITGAVSSVKNLFRKEKKEIHDLVD